MTTPPSATPLSADKLRERLGGVSSPEMNGDNLAITLCSHFDDPDDEDGADDSGWSTAAVNGCNSTLDAIHALYLATLTAKDEIIAGLTAESAKYKRHEIALTCELDKIWDALGMAGDEMEYHEAAQAMRARAETAESRVKVLEEALDAALKEQIAQRHAYCVGVLENIRRASLSPPTQVAPKEGT